jgi:hypothetical protein
MTRTILAAMLILASGAAATADTVVYHNTLKSQRGDYELKNDGYYCDQRVGQDRNGVPTSAAYKRCMASRGWRYQYTKHTPPRKTWIDPDTGLTCHDILGGFGSECSNF